MSDYSPDSLPARTAGSPSPSVEPPHAAGPGPVTLYRPPVAPPAHQLNPYEDRQWGAFAHFGGVAGFIPALVVYLNFKDRGRFARQESAEALNFQIAVVAIYIVCMIFSLIPFIGLLFSLAMMGLWVANIVLSILAGMAANKGEPYRYPLPLRFIS
jgi:uncharacterized Tic20 family protein